jgi:CheY-like chemotaxis protein
MISVDIGEAGVVFVNRPRRVVALSADAERPELLDALLADEWSDGDAVFVESISRGYERIKQLTPDVVIVMLDVGDAAGCRLLSMLKNDSELSAIPVVTWARTGPGGSIQTH